MNIFPDKIYSKHFLDKLYVIYLAYVNSTSLNISSKVKSLKLSTVSKDIYKNCTAI